MIEAKAFKTFIRICSLLKSDRLSSNIKLTIYRALIRSLMTYACLLRSSGRHLKKLNSAAWVRERTIPTETERPPLVGEVSADFHDTGCHMVSVTNPYGRNLGFVDRSRYFFFQAAPQLYSRAWADPVPDPLLLRKSGSTGNRIRTSGSVARNSDHYVTEIVCGRHLSLKIPAPPKQCSSNHWKFSKVHTRPGFAHDFHPSVCMRLCNKILQATNRSYTKHVNEYVGIIIQGEARRIKYKRSSLWPFK
jgi:hypothetical protein